MKHETNPTWSSKPIVVTFNRSMSANAACDKFLYKWVTMSDFCAWLPDWWVHTKKIANILDNRFRLFIIYMTSLGSDSRASVSSNGFIISQLINNNGFLIVKKPIRTKMMNDHILEQFNVKTCKALGPAWPLVSCRCLLSPHTLIRCLNILNELSIFCP